MAYRRLRSALAEPFGATATLRIGPIRDLTPSGELRVVNVGEMLGDDVLEVSVDHGPVQRPPFADDPIGERNPVLGPFADPRQPGLPLLERQRPQI
jgi:hypothetical protein